MIRKYKESVIHYNHELHFSAHHRVYCLQLKAFTFLRITNSLLYMVVANGVNDSVICTIMNNISFFIMFAMLPSEYFLYLSSINKYHFFKWTISNWKYDKQYEKYCHYYIIRYVFAIVLYHSAGLQPAIT